MGWFVCVMVKRASLKMDKKDQPKREDNNTNLSSCIHHQEGSEADRSKFLTVLHSKGILLTKKHDRGAKKTEGYGKAKMFRLETLFSESIYDLYQVLNEMSTRQHSCIVNGEPIEEWGIENTRDSTTLGQRAITFLPLDIDGVDVGEFNPNKCDEAAIAREVLSKLGLEWMGEYTFIWAWTSSICAPDWKGDARFRLWFQLDKPLPLQALKRWAKDIDCLDSAIYSPCQIIYTANPVFKLGSQPVHDRVMNRIGLAKGCLGNLTPSEQIVSGLTDNIEQTAIQNNESNSFERGVVLHSANKATIADLKSALMMIPADDYDQWRDMGLALASLKNTDVESDAFELWLDYSAKDASYQEDEAKAKWASFAPNRIDFRAIFNQAKALGWENPAAKSGNVGASPPLFELRSDGVYANNFNKSGIGTPRKICAPLRVLAKTRNQGGSKWGHLLDWQDSDQKSHKWSMPASLLHGDYSELAKNLASEGLDIVPGASKKVAEYVASVETDKRVECVDRLGWAKNSFVLPDQTIGENADKVVYQSEAITDHQLKSKGSLSEWQQQIALPCEANSRLILAICAGLAAPVLGSVDID